MEPATTPSPPHLPGGLLPSFPPLLSRAWTKWEKEGEIRQGRREGRERKGREGKRKWETRKISNEMTRGREFMCVCERENERQGERRG